MSRLYRQTTALVAILALGAPHLALADMRIPLDQIADRAAEAEADQPDRAARLADEIAGGMTANDLTCADAAEARPCPDGVPLVTPTGLAVELGEDDTIILAPRAEQALAQDLAAAAPEGQTEAIAEAPTDAPAEEIAAEPEAEAEADAEPAPVPEAEAAADDAAETPVEAPAAIAEAPPAEEPAADEPAAEEPAADEAAAQAEADTPDAAELAQRLADDAAEAPDTAADTTTAIAEAPAGEASADTPAPEAQAEAETVITEDDTPPEARGEVETAAASAAAAAIAPVAAALATDDASDDASDAETLTVTAEDARSSTEDFATRVSDGAQAIAPGGPEATSGRDGDRGGDIAKLVAAGLAGYVVGQMVGAQQDQGQVALNTGDRVVVLRPDGSQEVLKDDNTLLFRPGAQVQQQSFDDGSTRTVVTREDGSRVVTIRDADLRVLRRTLISADGTVVELIDDTTTVEPVRVSDLPPAARPVVIQGPATEDALRAALAREAATTRQFTLGQIRNIPEVRALVAPVNIDAITFDTGSAAIKPDQAEQLALLGRVIADYIRANPREVFMIEGYTDTVGAEAMNLALSDRRAESVALALTEYFGVPPENLVVQGYGERFLKIAREGDVRENRRVAVRRITDLLARN